MTTTKDLADQILALPLPAPAFFKAGQFTAGQVRSLLEAAASLVEAQQPAGQAVAFDATVDEFLEDYEMIGESEDGRDACYAPTEGEKFLIKDAIAGYLQFVQDRSQPEQAQHAEPYDEGYEPPVKIKWANPGPNDGAPQVGSACDDVASSYKAGRIVGAEPAPREAAEPVDQTEIAFEVWWKCHGQFCRAGGGDYEKTFAYAAWVAALEIPDAASPAQAAVADVDARLARFGALMMQEHRGPSGEIGDIDGFTAQERAVACGILEPRTVTEPCGESCECVGAFPTECFFLAAGMRDGIDRLAGMARGAGDE